MGLWLHPATVTHVSCEEHAAMAIYTPVTTRFPQQGNGKNKKRGYSEAQRQRQDICVPKMSKEQATLLFTNVSTCFELIGKDLCFDFELQTLTVVFGANAFYRLHACGESRLHVYRPELSNLSC